MSIQKSVLTLTTLFIFLIISTSSFAQYFWVGGSGDWNDFATHWATTSGGNSFHTAIPSSSDDVYFDTNSFTAIGQVVNITEEISCNSLQCLDVSFEPLIQMTDEFVFIVNGSLELTSEASYNFTTISLQSSNTVEVSTYGASLGSASTLEINGTGEFNFTGDLASSFIHLLSGTVNTNNYNISLSSKFETIGDLSKTLNLGTSVINCSQWRTGGDNNTINAGNSTIITVQFYPDFNSTGPYQYGVISFASSGNNVGLTTGSCVIGTIDATQLGTNSLKFSAGVTIEVGTILTSQDIHEPLLIEVSNSSTTHATIYKDNGTLDLSYVEMKNIHAEGGASFNVNPGVDNGNNDGWNFTEIVAIDFFWINNSGEWSDLDHWSSTSGGTNDQLDFPSRYDNTIFDENSFSSSAQTVTSDVAIQVNDMLWSDLVDSPIFNAIGGDNLSVYGDLYISDEVEMELTSINYEGNQTSNIRTSNQGYASVYVFTGNAIYELNSDVNCESFIINDGTFNTNNYDISTTNNFIVNFGNDKIINLGGSNIDAENYITYCFSCEVNTENSVITSHSSFRGGNVENYNHVILDGDVNVTNQNTFNVLEFLPGSNVSINSGDGLIINNDFILNGTPSQPISIQSLSVGEAVTFIKSSGTVNANYLIIQDNIATGGANFIAQQTIDNGNVSGWNITAPMPQDYFWVGDGGNWTDNASHWATTSGGTSFYDYPPGVLDNVFFDVNSFLNSGQIVTIDQESVICNTMDWSGVLNAPLFEGDDKTVICNGSLVFDDNMEVNVSEFNFVGSGNHIIDSGFEDSPGVNTSFSFSGTGVWDVVNSLTLENLNLESGIVNINGNDVHCSLYARLISDQYKELHLGASDFYSYHFGYFFGSNGLIDAGESTISVSGEFVPYPYNGTVDEITTLNNLHLVSTANDQAQLRGTFEVNQLTIDSGVDVAIRDEMIITVSQLIAQGTVDEHILIHSETVGTQSTIHQESGTVNGEYLELQDVTATGSAEFFANNSIDYGNVVGWIFTSVSQVIDFPEIDDVLENVGSITLDATTNSGLDITYEVIFGSASLSGNILTITSPGTLQIKASQEGNEIYSPAIDVVRTFCSIPLAPVITSQYFESFVTLSEESSNFCLWYFNGVQISDDPTPTIDVDEPGIYNAVRIISLCESDESNEINITVISVDEHVIQQVLDFYPNPANEKISISMRNYANAELKIFDLSGKLVNQIQITNGLNNDVIIDVQNLEKGVYLIALRANSGNQSDFYRGKLIKK